MSVPAMKAWPPAPRRQVTRTDRSAASSSQIDMSERYIAQVIALRAAGRSKTTWATPASMRRWTVPSPLGSLMGEGSGRGEAGALAGIDAQLAQHFLGVLAQQRRVQAHLLRRAEHLHGEADVRQLPLHRVVDLDAHAALPAMLAFEGLRIGEDRPGRQARGQERVDPVRCALRAEGLLQRLHEGFAVRQAKRD